MTDILILAGARTAIGCFGGALSAILPIDLAPIAAKATLARAGMAAGQVGRAVTAPSSPSKAVAGRPLHWRLRGLDPSFWI